MVRRSTEDLADRAEIALMTGRSATTTTALSDVLGVVESRAEDARTLVRRRAERLGPLHPFSVSGPLMAADKTAPGYRALLALSHLSRNEVPRGNRVLDQLVSRALRRLLGEPCTVVNFAWPPVVTQSPRPVEFPAAVRWLGSLLGLDVGVGYRSPARQDGGVDLVVGRVLDGSVKASPMLLVQTTLDRDTRKKARDVDLNLWRTWIDISPATQRCLAVPFQVGHDRLDELHRTGVVVLDRLRLTELLGADSLGDDGQMLNSTWVDEVIADRSNEWFA